MMIVSVLLMKMIMSISLSLKSLSENEIKMGKTYDLKAVVV
jgi:hypothetical protein